MGRQRETRVFGHYPSQKKLDSLDLATPDPPITTVIKRPLVSIRQDTFHRVKNGHGHACESKLVKVASEMLETMCFVYAFS